MILKPSYINEEEKFIINILSSIYPDKDFEPGSNYNDLIVKPLSTLFAYLKVYLVQSNQIANLLSYDANSFNGDINAAIRASLKNWLMTPRSGTYATGFVKFRVNNNTANIVISNEARVYRGGQAYKIDSNSPITISASLLEPHLNDSGVVVYYKTPPIPIKAEAVGAIYNATDGTVFNFWSRALVSDAVIGVETYGDIVGGSDEENAATINATSIKEALTVRNMVSKRSIIATIMSEFPDIIDVVPIGFKDPEMTRNKINLFGFFYRIGGCDDIYIYRPSSNKVKTGIVGEEVEIKRDSLPDNKFLIISNMSGIPINIEKAYVDIKLGSNSEYIKKGYPNRYIVHRVVAHDPVNKKLTLEIAPSCPESVLFGDNDFSIGIQEPEFKDIISGRSGLIGPTAPTGSSIILDYPVTSISRIAIHDPGNNEADPNTGYVELKKIVKGDIGINQCKIIVPEPDKFNSYGNSFFIMVHEAHIGKKYMITYESFNMNDVADFVLNSNNSILAINRLLRAKYVANVSLFIQCSVFKGVTINTNTIKNTIATVINTFDYENNELHCDLLKSILFNNGVEKAMLYANYNIMAPTGRVVRFISDKLISISSDNIDASSSEGDMSDLQGVTNKITQFYCNKDNIRIEIV